MDRKIDVVQTVKKMCRHYSTKEKGEAIAAIRLSHLFYVFNWGDTPHGFFFNSIRTNSGRNMTRLSKEREEVYRRYIREHVVDHLIAYEATNPFSLVSNNEKTKLSV